MITDVTWINIKTMNIVNNMRRNRYEIKRRYVYKNKRWFNR